MPRSYSYRRPPVTLPKFSFHEEETKLGKWDCLGDFEVIKTFEDGFTEIRFRGGKRERHRLHQCVECHVWSPGFMFPHALSVCIECASAENRRAKRAAIEDRRKKLIEVFGFADGGKRRAAMMRLASPSWRDKGKIRKIYLQCRSMNVKAAARRFEVDHIYPIQGRFSCGLHIHQNLRIITAFENRRKSNTEPGLDECQNLNYAIL